MEPKDSLAAPKKKSRFWLKLGLWASIVALVYLIVGMSVANHIAGLLTPLSRLGLGSLQS